MRSSNPLDNKSYVTCRWHVRLDVSGVGSVANLAKVSVLVTDPEPLLTELVCDLTGVFGVIRVFRDDGTGGYPGQTRW
jgi:hypothetical protein